MQPRKTKFWLEDTHEAREFDEDAEKQYHYNQRMSQVNIEIEEQKDQQLRNLVRQFRKDKALKDRSLAEIQKIARSYQNLDTAAKKAQ